MLEALIVGGIQEDHHLHALAREAIVHHFVTVALVAEAVELVGDELDCLALEGCRITFITIETGYLTEDSLDQVTNSHTRGDSVRVHDHVRDDSFNCEWQVFLAIRHTACTLLSMS